MTLAAYHLALDAHPEIGNNALLAGLLGLDSRERVLEWGFEANSSRPSASTSSLPDSGRRPGRSRRCSTEGPTRSSASRSSPAAPRGCFQVATLGYDAFVTGEPAEPTLHAARELETHFLAGGHYATETLGIKALAEQLAERFDLEWEFLDLPNPV